MVQTDASSLIPILVTLTLSLITRNVVIGLFMGVLSGAFMLTTINPIAAFGIMAR